MRIHLWAVGLAVCVCVATTMGAIVFEDHFDSYVDQAGVNAVWWGTENVANIGGGLVLSSAETASPPHSMYADASSIARMSAVGFTPVVASDPNAVEFSLEYCDITGTGNQRQFATIRDADPALSQMLAIGVYGWAVDPLTGLDATVSQLNTYYVARVTFGESNGWFLLNAPGAATRSAGWHELKIVIGQETAEFYVDGTLGLSRAIGSGFSWDHVTIGSGLSSLNGGAYYDNVKVRVLPEPVSLVLMAVGGVFLVRRRRV